VFLTCRQQVCGLSSWILNLYWTKWALAFVCLVFFYIFFLATCAVLSWTHSDFGSTLNSSIVSYRNLLLTINGGGGSRIWYWGSRVGHWPGRQVQGKCYRNCGVITTQRHIHSMGHLGAGSEYREPDPYLPRIRLSKQIGRTLVFDSFFSTLLSTVANQRLSDSKF